MPRSEPTPSVNKLAINNNSSNDDFADFQSAFDSITSKAVQPILSSNVVDLMTETSSNKPSDSAAFAAMNPFLATTLTEPTKPLFDTMSLLTPVVANNHLQSTAQQTAIKSEDTSSCSSSSHKIGSLSTCLFITNVLLLYMII